MADNEIFITEAKQHLRIEDENDLYDTQIQTIIDGVQDYVPRYLNKDLSSTLGEYPAIRSAMLLIIERMFDRHEDRYDKTLEKITDMLLWPYRDIQV